MFEIKSIVATTHDNSFGGFRWRVEVVVTMSARHWREHRRRGWLGQLYGIDISNCVYKINHNIPAHTPTVLDTDRSSRGVKTIRLTYYLNDADKAEALGLTVKRFKSGEVLGGYHEHVKIS